MNGAEGIARRLDHFLASLDLLEAKGLYWCWVGTIHSSDHFFIFLELGLPNEQPRSPFKYNSSWVGYEDFIALVRGNWQSFRSDHFLLARAQFVSNLKRLKGLVSSWARER